jgi:transposase
VFVAADGPFRSQTWPASLTVVLECWAAIRDGCAAGVWTGSQPQYGGSCHGIRPNLRIVCAVFAALVDLHGVTSPRAGALERAGLGLADWQHNTQRLADIEARMVAVLNELGLTAQSRTASVRFDRTRLLPVVTDAGS